MIITLGSRATITLPAELRHALSLEAGDAVEIKVHEGQLILTPVATVPRRLRLSPKGKAKEEEADKEIRAGRIKSFNSAQALIQDLHANRKD